MKQASDAFPSVRVGHHCSYAMEFAVRVLDGHGRPHDWHVDDLHQGGNDQWRCSDCNSKWRTIGQKKRLAVIREIKYCGTSPSHASYGGSNAPVRRLRINTTKTMTAFAVMI